MTQLDLFALLSDSGKAGGKIKLSGMATPVREIIKSVARQGHILVVSWSSGKDSTACLNLTLTALQEMSANGESVPLLVVMHADPFVENPAVRAHADQEIAAIRAYADLHGLQCRIEVSTPSLAAQWAVKVISGRNLPPLPGRPRDCTLDLKVLPMKRLKTKIMKELHAIGEPVTILGTRFAESAGRKKRMLDRGETHEGIWTDAEGLKLSPIAHWTDDDLWQYLYECANGLEKTYGDLAGLIQLYLDGARTTVKNCSGQDIPLDTRFGCAICTVGRDKSMEGMVAKGEKYAHLKPLLALQEFIRNTQFDFDRRTWIGRTINSDGFIAIGPDTYSPSMLADLLRYCLTIDIREAEAAYRLGLDPRFQMISPEALIAIDAIWSLQGIHKPFEALRIFRDINEGARYDIPVLPKPKPVKVPEPRYLFAGQGWKDIDNSFRHQGIRNVVLEMVSEGDTGCMGTRTLKDGRITLDVEMSEHEFTIDRESACLILSLEIDFLLDTYQDDAFSPRTTGYRYYASVGTLNYAHTQVSSSDLIMRRTAWKESLGLFDMSLNDLLALVSGSGEMP